MACAHRRKMKRNVKKLHNIFQSCQPYEFVSAILSFFYLLFLWFSMLNDDGFETLQRAKVFSSDLPTRCVCVCASCHYILLKWNSKVAHITQCVYILWHCLPSCIPHAPSSFCQRTSDRAADKNFYWKNHRNNTFDGICCFYELFEVEMMS